MLSVVGEQVHMLRRRACSHSRIGTGSRAHLHARPVAHLAAVLPAAPHILSWLALLGGPFEDAYSLGLRQGGPIKLCPPNGKGW